VIKEDDLVAIANRIWPPLDLLLGYLADGLREEYEDCIAKGIDPAEDACTFAGTVRRNVYDKMRPHLPPPLARAPMSPLHFDLGPYQLKVLHAEEGTVPRPRTARRRRYYRRNELGIMSMNLLLDHPLVVIEEEVEEIEDGSLVLVWDNDGPELTLADLYRPPLADFPGRSLDLLHATAVVVEPDFPGVRRDDTGAGDGRAATGTDDAGADEGDTGSGGDSAGPDDRPDETDLP
jgi:hypothetical protein